MALVSFVPFTFCWLQ